MNKSPGIVNFNSKNLYLENFNAESLTLRTDDNNQYQIMIYKENPVESCKSLV
jgi:hypothetical protein